MWGHWLPGRWSGLGRCTAEHRGYDILGVLIWARLPPLWELSGALLSPASVSLRARMAAGLLLELLFLLRSQPTSAGPIVATMTVGIAFA